MTLEEVKNIYPPYVGKTGNRFKDLTGLHIGSATFLYRTSYNPDNKKKINWVCLCDCGNFFTTYKSYSDCYSNGKEKQISCGCIKKYKDLVGEKFDKLTVLKKISKEELIKLKEIEGNKHFEGANRAHWLCQCDCGEERIVSTYNLITKNIKSCTKCAKKEADKKNTINMTNWKMKEHGVEDSLITVIERVEIPSHISTNGVYWKCLCECGNIFISKGSRIRRGEVKSCGCLTASIGEKKIEKILKDNQINFEKEKKFSDCKSEKNKYLRYDFYLPGYNLLIEYDGVQHYIDKKWDNLEEMQQRDNIKTSYALKNGYSLVRIPYTELNNIDLEMILGDKFLVKEEENEI